MPARIVLATGNAGKAREIRAILGTGFEIVTRREIGLADVDETGDSFLDNALLKARQAAAYSGLPAIADDSGLEVDALSGAPGVHSARYAGAAATDRDNVAKLLADLVSVPDGKRQARFRCVAVFVRHADDPAPIVAEGIWPGAIATEPRGNAGFGYDPVFIDVDSHRTAAELEPEAKNACSHRGQAFRVLKDKLAVLAV